MTETETYHTTLFQACLTASVLFPLVSFLVSFMISEKYSWIVSFTAPLLLLLSTLASGAVFYWTWNHPPIALSWHWFSVAGHTITAGILITNISALMLWLVTLISFLVNFYSTGYMAGDPGIKRYFGMLGFFTFAMLGIILADNLLLIFVFWELVGFSSYALIGHWKENPAAADAAKRAFLFNRVGDIGFLVGIMMLWTYSGSLQVADLQGGPVISSWQTVVSLCIFCGVIGKSAQFPLFGWLPDAMEGPTPVSALIHAATMVAAGVFLLARLHFLFTPVALDVVAIIGAVTALLGALSALVQHDIKKVLAYSTISQLGFMVLAAGAGAPDAAMFHLATHAFFKGCLFLAAGSVIHSLHQAQTQSHVSFNAQDIRNLGGLQKKLPFTLAIFIVSGSALAGLPFFAGFLSKEAILTALSHWKGSAFSWRWLLYGTAFVVSFITVLYTFRLIWSIFSGEEKSTKNLVVLEPPLAMRAPMAATALASCWIFFSWNPFDFQGWLFNALHNGKYFHLPVLTVVSAVWVLLALVTAYLTRNKTIQAPILFHALYLNVIYQMAIINPAMRLAHMTERTDRKWIDGILHTGAYTQLMLAHVTGWFDRVIVDGMVDGVAGMARGVGAFTRSFQRGKIQLYIFWAIFAIIIFIIWTLL